MGHTAFVTEDGGLYTMGEGQTGMLGHGDTSNKKVPTRVQALEHERVVQVAAGGVHTACITETGALYTMGEAQGGKLGYQSDDQILLPKRVDALAGETVVMVAAGMSNTACVTDTGKLYTMGRKSSGQLGQGSVVGNTTLPTQVKGLDEKRVVLASVGGSHCLLDRGW